MQKYECGNCCHLFDERERICENWRDPEKSLICPKCKHYLLETYDDTLDRKLGNWFLLSLPVVGLAYVVAEYMLDANSASNAILVVGSLVVVLLAASYRVSTTRRFMGNIGTKSIGQSNM